MALDVPGLYRSLSQPRGVFARPQANLTCPQQREARVTGRGTLGRSDSVLYS